MKKLVSIILSLTLLASISTTAFATDGSGSADISLHIYSRYIVDIPAMVFSDTNSIGTVSVYDALIEDGKSIKVYPTNTDELGNLTLYHATKEGKTATITLNSLETGNAFTSTNPIATFDSTLFENTREASKSFGMSLYSVDAAGDFEGTLTYSFTCD